MTKRRKDTNTNTTTSWSKCEYVFPPFFYDGDTPTTLSYHRLIEEKKGKVVSGRYATYDAARMAAENKSSRDGVSYLIVEVMGEVKSVMKETYKPIHVEYEIV